MPAWGWVLIVIGAVVVVATVAWQAMSKRRTAHLRGRFGPEYDRVADDAESRRDAERELRAREQRRERLDIRPLPAESRERYVATWQSVQAQFVDDPRGATWAADGLIRSVMEERGYPMTDFDQRAADISVDHPTVVENYREGHRLAQSSDGAEGATEDLRQAMRHYRALFEELVEAGAAEEPLSREPAAEEAPTRSSPT